MQWSKKIAHFENQTFHPLFILIWLPILSMILSGICNGEKKLVVKTDSYQIEIYNKMIRLLSFRLVGYTKDSSLDILMNHDAKTLFYLEETSFVFFKRRNYFFYVLLSCGGLLLCGSTNWER